MDDKSFDGKFGNQTNHIMKRRSFMHNYSKKGFYMLTLTTLGRQPLLGDLNMQYIRITLSSLGSTIFNCEIKKISNHYPMVEVWRVCVMPDHIHLIVRVKEDMPPGTHLGTVVSGFKAGCNQAYWKEFDIRPDSNGKRPPLFECGYNDRLIFGNRHLDVWKKYLADNPRRLALKRANPDLFKTIYSRTLMGVECQMVGNIFLLNNPDKAVVWVHSKDTDEIFEQKKRSWLACGERGGVLVSAAISKREREVINEAQRCGYAIIHICNVGFNEFYKPSGAYIDSMAEGRLLELSPWGYRTHDTHVCREDCVYMNYLAEWIATHL